MKQWLLLLNVFMATVLTAVPSYSQAPTVYEPSASDPRVIAVIEAQKRLEDVSMRGDWKALEDTVFAPDLVVHAPINRVANRDNVMSRMRSGEIAYEGGEHRVEFIGVRGDSVVAMGEEIVRPVGIAPNAGKVVRRRFTDIWRNYSGTWKLAVRQATVTSVE